MVFMKLKILSAGDGGHAFKSGIESQMIRAGPGNSLGLISPTGRLNINGPQKIDFHSFAGPINVHALKHIHLRARRGNVSTIIILNDILIIYCKKNRTCWCPVSNIIFAQFSYRLLWTLVQ